MSVVLFLDIDGVLNGMSHDFDDAPPDATLHERMSRHMVPELVARLVRVLRETGCLVVVSSTWRLRFSAAEIAAMMAARGLPLDMLGRFIGRTDSQPVPYDWPDRSGRERGLQIQRWLDATPGVERFAIVDDDSDMAHLHPFLVQTDTLTGMTDADADRLIAMLADAR